MRLKSVNVSERVAPNVSCILHGYTYIIYKYRYVHTFIYIHTSVLYLNEHIYIYIDMYI